MVRHAHVTFLMNFLPVVQIDGMHVVRCNLQQGSAIWDPGIPNPGFFVNESQIPIPDPRFLKPIPNPNPRSQIFKIKSQSQSQIPDFKNQIPIPIPDPGNPGKFSQIPEIPEKSQKSPGSQIPDTIFVLFHIKIKKTFFVNILLSCTPYVVMYPLFCTIFLRDFLGFARKTKSQILKINPKSQSQIPDFEIESQIPIQNPRFSK